MVEATMQNDHPQDCCLTQTLNKTYCPFHYLVVGSPATSCNHNFPRPPRKLNKLTSSDGFYKFSVMLISMCSN